MKLKIYLLSGILNPTSSPEEQGEQNFAIVTKDTEPWPHAHTGPRIAVGYFQDNRKVVLVNEAGLGHGFKSICDWFVDIYQARIEFPNLVDMATFISRIKDPSSVHENVYITLTLERVTAQVVDEQIIQEVAGELRSRIEYPDLNNMDALEFASRNKLFLSGLRDFYAVSTSERVTAQLVDEQTLKQAASELSERFEEYGVSWKLPNNFVSPWQIIYHAIDKETTESLLQLKKDVDQQIENKRASCFTIIFSNPKGRWWRILKDFSAFRAIHNSEDHHEPPRCHPETRIAIRKALMDWAGGLIAPEVKILWLYGTVGIGKTAIARTVAEACDQRKMFLASFFFSRTDSTRNTVTSLVATIAYQIGNAIRQSQDLILKTIERNPKIFLESFATQLMELVLQPLSEIVNEGAVLDFPRLIIIDGLDECVDSTTQSQIVTALLGSLRDIDRLSLRFLIVSREAQHLRDAFDSVVPTSMLHRIALDGSHVSDSDIRVFLQAQFADIKKKNSSIPTSWPTSSIVDHLVQRSHHRFVYASTAMKYVTSHDDPISCLDAILECQLPQKDQEYPLADLDALYSLILSNVQDPKTTMNILGVVLFVDPEYDSFGPLSTQSSAAQMSSGVKSLLGLDHNEVQGRLSKLYPMVYHSRQGDIRIPDATVAEFLSDPARSKSFYIDKYVVSAFLTRGCFDVIKNSTDFDLLWFSYGHILNLCRSTQRTPDLLEGLKDFSLHQSFHWCRNHAHRFGGVRRKNLLPWWYVTKFLVVLRQIEATELYLHHLSAFDKLLREHLVQYPSLEDVHLLLALSSAPFTTLNLTQERVTSLLDQMLSYTSAKDSSPQGLGILSMFAENSGLDNNCFRVGRHSDQDIVMDTYHRFLLDFFMDHTRSAPYDLSPDAYTSLALKALQFMSRTSDHLSPFLKQWRTDKPVVQVFLMYLLVTSMVANVPLTATLFNVFNLNVLMSTPSTSDHIDLWLKYIDPVETMTLFLPPLLTKPSKGIMLITLPVVVSFVLQLMPIDKITDRVNPVAWLKNIDLVPAKLFLFCLPAFKSIIRTAVPLVQVSYVVRMMLNFVTSNHVHALWKQDDSVRAMTLFLPHLLTKSSKSIVLLNQLRSTDFDFDADGDAGGVFQSIVQYKEAASKMEWRLWTEFLYRIARGRFLTLSRFSRCLLILFVVAFWLGYRVGLVLTFGFGAYIIPAFLANHFLLWSLPLKF